MLLNEVVGQCASGNSCQLSPPGTSMTCASSAYYPATDAVGLVTAAEKEAAGLGDGRFRPLFWKFPLRNVVFTGKSDGGKDVATFGNCGSRWQMTV